MISRDLGRLVLDQVLLVGVEAQAEVREDTVETTTGIAVAAGIGPLSIVTRTKLGPTTGRRLVIAMAVAIGLPTIVTRISAASTTGLRPVIVTEVKGSATEVTGHNTTIGLTSDRSSSSHTRDSLASAPKVRHETVIPLEAPASSLTSDQTPVDSRSDDLPSAAPAARMGRGILGNVKAAAMIVPPSTDSIAGRNRGRLGHRVDSTGTSGGQTTGETTLSGQVGRTGDARRRRPV